MSEVSVRKLIRRYSSVWGKTLKTLPKEAQAISHRLLLQGGFIDLPIGAGLCTFLPLGWRVHQKLANVIREEMNTIGGQETSMPVLQPKDLWVESDRWDHMDPPLFRLKDRHNREYCLAPTHEEVITDMARRFIHSYKDLPLAVYQIQLKMRNEMRATGGLLRTREFWMKDLYSFHSDEADLDAFYWQVARAYSNIFKRCGVDTRPVEALSGTIGGAYCHEYMTICPIGEDTIVYCTGCDWAANVEWVQSQFQNTDIPCPKCRGKVQVARAIENGHIFKLGTKYSEMLAAHFIDQDGGRKPVVMGCYGIGLGRLMSTVVEVNHDDRGIIWPVELAPYAVHLIAFDQGNSVVDRAVEEILEALTRNRVSVLFDDREPTSPGEKMADADLIGIPLRAIVSKRTTSEGDKVEVKRRTEARAELVTLPRVIELLRTAT